MKKITLLFALLITSIGFSQDFKLGFETGESGGLLDIFGNGNAMKANVITDGGTNGTKVLKIIANSAGEVWQGSNFKLTNNVDLSTTQTMTMDVFSATPITFLVKVNGGLNGAAEAAAEVTHNGDGTWQTLSFTFNSALDGKAAAANGVYQNFVIHAYWKAGQTGFGGVTKDERTFYVDNFKGPSIPAGSDATLSDLKVSGTTISGFNIGTEMYNYEIATGGSVPVVTATASDAGNATVTITQATSIPGNTTVKVVSKNTTVTKTYTVAFKYEIVPVDSPATPPTRNAWDVISLYGDSYGTAEGLNGVTWDNGANAVQGSYAGNNALKITKGTGDFIGFDIGNTNGFVNATDMTHVHVDFWVAGSYVAGQVLKIKLSNHNTTKEINSIIKEISPAAADMEKWLSIDMAIGAGARERIAQILLIYTNSAGAPDVIYADNIYMYRAATASVDKNNLLKVSLYPSPAKDQLRISAKNTIQSVSIYNLLGKRVKNVVINKKSDAIDVSNLSSGIYILKYTVDSTVGSMKFIKE